MFFNIVLLISFMLADHAEWCELNSHGVIIMVQENNISPVEEVVGGMQTLAMNNFVHDRNGKLFQMGIGQSLLILASERCLSTCESMVFLYCGELLND